MTADSAFGTTQQNWDSWFQDQRRALDERMQAFAGMQDQWGSLFKEWGKKTGAHQMAGQTGAPPNAAAFGDFFTKAGESYLSFISRFTPGNRANNDADAGVMSWLSDMQRFMENMLQAQSQPTDPMAQFGKVMENMFQTGPSLWAHAFGNPAAAKPEMQTAHLFDPFGFYASLPGIGMSREKQEHINKLYQLFVEYDGAMRRYSSEMIKVGMIAQVRFQDFLKSPPKDAPPLSSLKEIYAKWVDVCEEVYARFAMSEDYTRLYGEVVNALMAFKKQANLIVDDTVEAFNLPTRKEVDSLHKRMHDLRRENNHLRKAVWDLMDRDEDTAPVFEDFEEDTDTSAKPKPAKAKPVKAAAQKKPAVKKPVIKKPAAKKAPAKKAASKAKKAGGKKK